MSVDGRIEIIQKFSSMDDVTLAYINYLWEKTQFYERQYMQGTPVTMQASEPTSATRRGEELLAKNVTLERENRTLRQALRDVLDSQGNQE